MVTDNSDKTLLAAYTASMGLPRDNVRSSVFLDLLQHLIELDWEADVNASGSATMMFPVICWESVFRNWFIGMIMIVVIHDNMRIMFSVGRRLASRMVGLVGVVTVVGISLGIFIAVSGL
jgi:hypothetical protein